MSEQNKQVATRNNISTMIKDARVSAIQLVKSREVRSQFVNLYAKIHGITNLAKAQAFCEAETYHFLKIVNDSKELSACTKLSLYGVFMDVAVSGLSFDPTMRHCYVVSFNTNVGTKENKKWEKRANLMISGQGELILRTMQGQVKYADNPVLVYEGDKFEYGTWDGKVRLNHVAVIPRKSEQIIACYIKITRHDDTTDYKVLTMDELMNLRKFSKDPNSLAWTSGLAGMMQAKTIKHAFKSYPKVRVGSFSKQESEVVDADAEDMDRIDYGMDLDVDSQVDGNTVGEQIPFTPHEDVNDNPQEDENAFANEPQKQQAATVTHDDENF